MIKKPRTRTSSRTITIRERRAIRRPVSPGLSPLTSHPTFHLADPPTRRYADPLPPASHLSPLTFRRRRPAGPFLPLADTSTRRHADPLPLASHLRPFTSPTRRYAVSPIRFSRSPTRRHADPLPLASHLADPPIRRFADPFLPPADPPIRRFADPFLPRPLSRLFACSAGPSVFVSPNGTRRSLITLTGASLKWPL
jgi:hypothetical protein